MPLFYDLTPQDRLRIELKKWESDFSKINGRKPGTADIEAAGSDVKSLYKRYWSVVKGKDNSREKKASNEVPRQPLGENNASNAIPLTTTTKVCLKDVKTTELKQDDPIKVPGNENKVSSLPSGVWGDQLLKKNFVDKRKGEEKSACKKYLNNLMKHYQNKQIVKKRELFLKNKKRKSNENSISTSTVTSPSSSLLSSGDINSAGGPTEISGEYLFNPESIPLTNLIIGGEGDTVSNHTFLTPASIDIFDGNAVDTPLTTESATIFTSITSGSTIFPSPQETSHESSSGSSLKENVCRKEPSLFSDDEDEEGDPVMKAVKEHITQEIKEMEEFAGCELLPEGFKPKKKRKTSLPSVKAIKKRNDEYCVRVDLKKKSFASKGYKKINVQKMKRQSHRWKSRRSKDKCFVCSEKGHWSADCPLKKTPQEAVDVGEEENPDSLMGDVQIHYYDAPILSADQIVHEDNDDDREAVDQEALHENQDFYGTQDFGFIDDDRDGLFY